MTTADQLFKLCFSLLAALADRFAALRTLRRSQCVQSNQGDYSMTIQRCMWAVMTLSAMLLAAYAGSFLLLPTLREPFLQQLFANTPIAIATHIGGSLVAILTGAAQASLRLRTRFLTAHRWFGRVYVIAVLIGGAAGLVLAANSTGGVAAQTGFGSLAVCWVSSTLNAYRYILIGNKLAHGSWMIRSYGLTLAGVTFRLSLPLLEAAGVEYETAYRVASWASWLPNLLIAEWMVRTHRRRSPPALKRVGTISRTIFDML